jgi:hypothetical protein
VLTRPARSSGTPSDFASGEAATPAAQRTVSGGNTLGRCRRRRTARHGHTVVVDGCDDSGGAHLDAQALQIAPRESRNRSANGGSTYGLPSTEHDAGRLGTDAPKVLRERLPRDLGERAGQFHAGRSGADDDERQQPAPLLRVALALGRLERQQHPPPHLERVVQRLQAGCARLPLRVAEVGVRCAGGDNQIVVRDLIAVDRHALCRQIDRLDVGEQHLDISLTAQHPADRRGDVAWRQRRGRHL